MLNLLILFSFNSSAMTHSLKKKKKQRKIAHLKCCKMKTASRISQKNRKQKKTEKNYEVTNGIHVLARLSQHTDSALTLPCLVEAFLHQSRGKTLGDA